MNILFLPVVFFIVALWRPRWAVAGLVLAWPAYLWRGAILNIPTTALELSIFAVALAMLFFLLRRKTVWPTAMLPRWTMGMLGIWCLAWVLSTFFSTDRTASLGAFKAWLFDPLLFAFCVSALMRSAQDRVLLIKSAILSGCAVAIGGLVQVAWFRQTLQDGRLSSFFHPVANYAAMYLGPIFLLALAVVTYKMISSKWWAAVIVIGAALALTVSYGGYLAATSGCIVLWFGLPKSRLKTWSWRTAIVLGIIFVTLLSTTRNFREHFGEGRSSAAVRTQIWVTSWALIKQRPIFGIGPNTFEVAYRTELPHHYFPPLEWLVAQPHNLYLALWLETGLLGLVAFLGLIIAHLTTLVRLVRLDPARRQLAILSVAIMVAILVHGLVDTPYFKNDLAPEFFFFLLLPWLGNNAEKKSETKNTA